MDGKYSQRDLAEKYGVSATTVSKNFNFIVDSMHEIAQKLLDESKTEAKMPKLLSSAPGAGGKRPNEAFMNQIRRELEGKNFDSMEDANAFLQQLMENGIPKINHDKLSIEVQAQNLIYEAWNKKDAFSRIKLAREALKIDPACVDAYVILAEDEATSFAEKEALYPKAIEKGRSALGKEFFKKNMGSFWLITETRPFMRAQMGLALLFWENDRLDEAANAFKEMLRLNTNDNQGVRYVLLPLLLELKRFKEALKLIESYEEECNPQWSYSIALYNFIVVGKKSHSNTWLKGALKDNQFVPQYLLGFSPMPKELPEYSKLAEEMKPLFTLTIVLGLGEKPRVRWIGCVP